MLVKICGIKNKETLFCCEKNRVDFFGMIFYEKSPRNINLDEAKHLQILSKELNIKGVGVFVNKEINELKKYINNLKLKFVQLHGHEDDEYLREIKKCNVKVIKKISVRDTNDLENIKKFRNADFFLFDYKPETNDLPGGNSKSFDWRIIIDLQISKPWFLSGGINFKNIQNIKEKIKPFGVDLSSGVEKELGIKNNEIINNFMSKFRDA